MESGKQGPDNTAELCSGLCVGPALGPAMSSGGIGGGRGQGEMSFHHPGRHLMASSPIHKPVTVARKMQCVDGHMLHAGAGLVWPKARNQVCGRAGAPKEPREGETDAGGHGVKVVDSIPCSARSPWSPGPQLCSRVTCAAGEGSKCAFLTISPK